MAKENGKWIIRGLEPENPDCIMTPEGLTALIREVGFLPLFRNAIPGFSVEEHTASRYWWSGAAAHDPWEWRKILPARGELAYGKFFGGKAGYISREWFPVFANYRRNGYDFDSLYEDELASHRSKKIMDLFDGETELYSFEVRRNAGFDRGGEKNFEGVMTALQMQTYLIARDLRQRRTAAGKPYGWAVTVYSTPEHVYGYDWVTSAYSEDPSVSRERILRQLADRFPGAGEALARSAGVVGPGSLLSR